MLSYNDSQAGKLSYDRYQDTDPDNAGDQLVDFSKRYPENDPEEVCRPSSVKNSQMSLTTMNCGDSKVDELKFFCDEGTPGMASSESSLWDLREVGVIKPSSEALISEEQTREECCFSSPPDFSVGSSNSTKNCIDSNLVADEAGKRESNNEALEEYINPEATKLSSPLMFSRSSSVGSLNSFGQHSIVDDRSSVSAFSNLASGLISPSEIPDSPCGVESPFISKSKNNEFLFPSNDKSVDPILVDQTIHHEDFPDEVFGNPDGIKVFDDEGDCSSVSNLSALSIQANSSLHLLSLAPITQIKNDSLSLIQKSSVTVNCPITVEETDFIEKCQNLNISDESYIPEQNCINTKSSHPLDVTDVSQNENSLSIIETKYEDKGTSTSEDFHFHDRGYKWTSFPFKDMVKLNERQYLQQNEDKQLGKEDFHRIVTQFQELMAIEGPNIIESYLLQNKPSNYSKEISDDESDGILEECILSGMPSKDSSMFNDSKQSLNHSFQTSGSLLKDDMPNCSLSDNDLSDDDDDDDGILNECVLLGMPQNSTSVQIETESYVLEAASCSSVATSKSSMSNSPSHHLKLFHDTNQSTMLSREKHLSQESGKSILDLVVPEVVSNQRNFVKEEEFSTFNLISHSKEQDDIKEDLAKSSDDDSDIDESDLLVQQCIQLGRSELRNPKAPAETKLCVIPSCNKALGSRDNWPDGVSDGEDDDDDILSEIIKAGRPDSNSQTNKSPYAGSKPCIKSQNQRKLTAAEDRALYLNKDSSSIIPNYGNIIPKEIVQKASENALIDTDSMFVFWTEDTPILSPSASTSDLSTLSFPEEKICQESFLNNSRNSDCSSDSEDDEMLLQCIRQGMPGGRRVGA